MEADCSTMDTDSSTITSSSSNTTCDSSVLTADSSSIAALPKRIKLVLVGDGSTGKTSYIARLCREGFHSEYVATMGYEKSEVLIHTTHGGDFIICFWDTAGQEKAGPMRDQYYEDAEGAILFFDVTSRVTYKNIPTWHRDLTRVCNNIPVVLFANKVDVKERKVKGKSINYHQKFPKSMIMIEGSVKDRINLKEPIEYLLQSICNEPQLKIVTSLETSLFLAFESIDVADKGGNI